MCFCAFSGFFSNKITSNKNSFGGFQIRFIRMNHQINELPSSHIVIDGVRHLYFSGTGYLGMGHQPEFRIRLLEGLEKYGTVFSSSRNGNVQLSIYEEGEEALASWASAEAALTVSSGMVAGMVAIKSIPKALVVRFPNTHPALWEDENRGLDYKFLLDSNGRFDINRLVKLKQAFAAKSPIVLVVGAVDPLYCKPSYFDWVDNIPEFLSVVLVVDDSHGIGITGVNGSGIYQFLQKKISKKFGVELIVIASLGKAMGLPAGVVLGTKNRIAAIKDSPFFSGASPTPPAYLYAWLHSQDLYAGLLETLRSRISYFTSGLKGSVGFDYLPQYPVFYTCEVGLYRHLLAERIMISSFPYPSRHDAVINRIVISALHTTNHLDELLRVINDYGLISKL
jgi:8-amino-7-oxononanoate synthase